VHPREPENQPKPGLRETIADAAGRIAVAIYVSAVALSGAIAFLAWSLK